MVSCQHGVASTRCRVKMNSCQNDIVSTRCRIKTMLCQHDVVSMRCRVNMMSCQHDTVSKRFVPSRNVVNTAPFQNGVVPTPCRANTTSSEYVVLMRHRKNKTRCQNLYIYKTMSCQHDTVSGRRHAKTMSYSKWCRANMVLCQHDVVSSRHRANTMSFQ